MSEAPSASVISSADLQQRRALLQWFGYTVLAILASTMIWIGVKEKKEITSECDAIIAEIWPSIPKNLSNVEKTDLIQTAFEKQWKNRESIRWEVRDECVIAFKKKTTSLLVPELFRFYKIQEGETLKPYR